MRDLPVGSSNVVVVGLQARPYRISHSIARSLRDFGFRIFPVNLTSADRFLANNRSHP
jgi:predicted CoA-binding protein